MPSMPSACFTPNPHPAHRRDIGALAGQEMEARLAESVGGLRRGLAQARAPTLQQLMFDHSCCLFNTSHPYLLPSQRLDLDL